MQINNVSKFGQNISNLNLTNNSEQLTKNQSSESIESTSKPMAKQYDVRHMSTNEFSELITDLRESGQVSGENSLMLTVELFDLEYFGGISKDTKIDLVAYFEEQIDYMKSNPETTKGVEFHEWTLDILKAIEARNVADIPKSV